MGNASSTAPPLYAAQYAMNSLQYQDVNVNMNVPLSMLVMHHVNNSDEHPHHESNNNHHHPHDSYSSYDSVGQIREDHPSNNSTLWELFKGELNTSLLSYHIPFHTIVLISSHTW
ncbi:hypothetical protein Pst134EB_009980 [Puccinia striiformis f. sp. tritici]|nr:hypothetical protein Pst134EB_009980 [Puccinia striiformis f. sp. tritici]